MTEQTPFDEFKRIWHDQSTEDTKLILEQVREKARRVQLQKRLAGLVTLPVSIGMTLFFSRFLVSGWREHRPGWVLLILIAVSLHGVYHSMILIRTRRIAANAGLKTSLEAYRSYFELERALTPRGWAFAGLMMLVGGIATINLWVQLPIFPAWDAAKFGVGCMLISLIVYLSIRYKYRQIDRALHMVEGLEKDVE